MSNICGTMVDVAIAEGVGTEKLSEGEREGLIKLAAIEAQIKHNPVFRAHIGLSKDDRRDVQQIFKGWVIHKLGPAADPSQYPLTKQDINFLFAEAYKAIDVYHRTRKWGSNDKLHAWINKWIYLPQDVFRRDIIGGEDYFMETQLLKSDRDRMRSVSKTHLDIIGRHMQTLTGVERRLIDSVIVPAQDRLARAKNDYVEYQAAQTKDPAILRRLLAEVRNAEANLNMTLRGEGVDPKIARGIRMIRSIQMALDGKFLDTNPVTGEERTVNFKLDEVTTREIELDSGERVLFTEKKVNRAQLTEVFTKVFGEGRRGETHQAAEIIKELAEFLDDYADITRKAFKAERENMIHVVMRSGGNVARDVAEKLVDQAMKLRIEELYFPRESMSALHRIERISVEMDTASDKISLLQRAIEHPDDFAFPGESTQHVLARTYGIQSSDASHDMMGVLERYSARMVDYYHNNQLQVMSNRLLDNLWEAKRNISNPTDAKLFEGYVDGVTKYIADFVDRSKNSVQGGKLHEVVKTLVAWKAGMTMGFFNPSSPALNLAEGQLMTLVRAGRHYFMNRDKENQWGDVVQRFNMGREFTNLTEEVMLGEPEGPVLDLRTYSNMDNATRRAAGLVEIDRQKVWLHRVNAAVSWIAKKGLVAQKKAENLNRARAFKIGALMEWDWLQQYEKIFIGKEEFAKNMLSPNEMEMLGIEAKDLVNEGNRRIIWERVAKRRLTRAGFENVFMTQFNYNQVARHYVERQPIGKLAVMYQHYPLSWLMTWRRTMENMNALYRAGSHTGSKRKGVQAMLEANSKDGHLNPIFSIKGHSLNNDAQFALITGAIAMTLAGIRYGTGIVPGQLFMHPVSESAEDMVKYVKYGFEGKYEAKKSLFWSKGIVNQFTGPAYTDLMDAISLGAMKAGIEDGDMPRWTADILRGTVGFRPDEVVLTEYGRRQFGNAHDVLYETFLFGGMSVAPKARRLAQAIPGIGEHIGGRPNGVRELSYQTFRAFGIRDEFKEPGVKTSTKEKDGRV